MTIEEAIKHCEEVAAGETEQGKCPGCAADHKQLAEWLREVVTLRAQQTPLDRGLWEGCPQCTWGTEGLLQREVKYGWKRGESVISGPDEMYIIRYGEKDYALICECTEENEHETEISFCPYCGRPLTEEAWAELERRINDGTTD